ncbi:helix-turn-helix transcriptional regulator [Paraburkholderia fungorum]|jgi:transcriptional regulator with XRE-family HTH domain|uniref:helix-turn-helix domain-containing protein n=1 Tax=Paraburkholderia fungorum TaxID=134537 RepID=UPI0038BC3D91
MIERPPVGKVIRSLRRGLKLTQNELASRCGLTAQYLSLLELGQVNVSLDTLLAISSELGQPLSTMLLEAEALVASEQPKSKKRKPTA